MTDLEKELVEKLAIEEQRPFYGATQDIADMPIEVARKRVEVMFMPLIRSHTQALVAAAYAACAEHHPQDELDKACKCSCGVVCESWAQWEAHIRSLTPADAARELERRELSISEYEKVDLVKRWRDKADDIGRVAGISTDAGKLRTCAAELETWLAVNLERIKRKARLYPDTEVALLRGRLHTIGMAGEFGATNSQVVARLRELESQEDQCRQYIQHAQEREHEINVLRERIASFEAQAKEKP